MSPNVDLAPTSTPSSSISAAAPDSGPSFNHVFSFAGLDLATGDRGLGSHIRSHDEIAKLRSLFGSVIVSQVVVDLVLWKGDHTVSIALAPDTVAKPTTREEVVAFPHAHVVRADDTTGTNHRFTFTSANVPGIEWDLGAEVVRNGHPVPVVMQWRRPSVSAEQNFQICQGRVEVTLRCSGASFGVAPSATGRF